MSLSFEEFYEDPACQECRVPLRLRSCSEWPEDPRLWLCGSCMTDLAELLLFDSGRMLEALKALTVFETGTIIPEDIVDEARAVVATIDARAGKAKGGAQL